MQQLQAAAMTTKTILLINSEPIVRELVQDCLSHLGGWRVLSTGSSLEGLQRAIQEQPDAIVFDLSTQGMNFYTFLKRLRAQPATQTIPVVVAAAGAKWFDLGLFQQFRVVGIVDYATDPVQIPQQVAHLLRWDEES